MQTILGSGGAIGRLLAQDLRKYDQRIRLVSRKPTQIHPEDELFPADLTHASKIDEAVKGSQVVYITIGFPYSYKVWKKHWPKFIRSTLESCAKHNSRLVFFDNVYMYDPKYLGRMNEECPVNPCSKKGEVRAAIAQQVLDAHKEGNVHTLIARSADFYGPGTGRNGILNEMLIKPILAGKSGQWLLDPEKVHSFTFTPDATQATAHLGQKDEAYGQVWHLPTAYPPLTAQQYAETIAELSNQKEQKIRPINKKALKILGFFVPVLKELKEMSYQYDRDYFFDSGKIESRYGLLPTSYLEGLRQVLKSEMGN